MKLGSLGQIDLKHGAGGVALAAVMWFSGQTWAKHEAVVRYEGRQATQQEDLDRHGKLLIVVQAEQAAIKAEQEAMRRDMKASAEVFRASADVMRTSVERIETALRAPRK